MNSLIPAVLGTLFIASSAVAQTQTRIEHQPFGSAGGVPVELYVLTSTSGAVAKIMTYGATLTELDVPNRAGRLDDVVLGFDSLKGYLGSEPYFGATVGRVGNRIAKGRFSLNGKSYQLATNDGPNHLHGGIKGFDKVVWQAEVVSLADGPGVKFTHVSADGEEGYPGKCTVSVVYQLSGTTLALSYEAVSDKDTPVNVTNHSYFNLGGAENGAILGHVVTLYADRFTPVDAFLIPTGELRPVAGTPMDFRQPTRVGARIKQAGRLRPQLRHQPGPIPRARALAPCRHGQRAHVREGDGRLEHGARRTVLQRQLPRREPYWQERGGLSPILGPCAGDAAFPGFGQPSEFSIVCAEGG